LIVQAPRISPATDTAVAHSASCEGQSLINAFG